MRPGVIASLRDIVPLRPLTRTEAVVIAERQATRLRTLLDVHDDALDDQDIIDLPRLEVRRHSPWPSSGASQWIDGRWVIVLNASEPAVRQRFSLCHELKHILDHRFADLIHRGIPTPDRHSFVEGTCDYFAGCLLMPRPLVKQAWTTRSQRLDVLARCFHVSQPAMATRLSQIGLTGPTPRCAPVAIDRAAFDAARRSGARYQRTSTSVLAGTRTRSVGKANRRQEVS